MSEMIKTKHIGYFQNILKKLYALNITRTSAIEKHIVKVFLSGEQNIEDKPELIKQFLIGILKNKRLTQQNIRDNLLIIEKYMPSIQKCEDMSRVVKFVLGRLED